MRAGDCAKLLGAGEPDKIAEVGQVVLIGAARALSILANHSAAGSILLQRQQSYAQSKYATSSCRKHLMAVAGKQKLLNCAGFDRGVYTNVHRLVA